MFHENTITKTEEGSNHLPAPLVTDAACVYSLHGDVCGRSVWQKPPSFRDPSQHSGLQTTVTPVSIALVLRIH